MNLELLLLVGASLSEPVWCRNFCASADNDGTVSFAEFADYMATLALLAPEGVEQENDEDLPFPEPVSANS